MGQGFIYFGHSIDSGGEKLYNVSISKNQSRGSDMKILYRQTPRTGKRNSDFGVLEACGIGNCYYKHILQENADKSNTKRDILTQDLNFT